MHQLTKRVDAHEFYREVLGKAKKEGPEQVKAIMAYLGRNDLFFLLCFILSRSDIDRDWLFDRCREVQLEPNGYLDLWAREHYKSTIITFAMTIQDVLNDPEITIGIFSLTRPLSKDPLAQIKWEFENNQRLIELYPDVLWENPKREAPTWSLDTGLKVKRQSNPREATIEAWGLVDSMPTGKHFQIRVYDDVIDERNVSNPDMIKKAVKAWELSLNLGSMAETKRYGVANIDRYIGTRYHLNDPYKTIMDRGTAKPRIYPGTENGKVDGEPVLWDQEFIAEKRRDMGPYVFGCQILQDPQADEVQGFKIEWLLYWDVKFLGNLNIYILVDPAGEKKVDNDYTVIMVIGLGSDKNIYEIDGVRDRLNLTERTNALIRFHRQYKPHRVGYEKYGKDSDIEHIEYVQKEENYRFDIHPLSGRQGKYDRIRKLIPIFEQGRWYLARHLYFVDHERRQRDFNREFIRDEYLPFPLCTHDDMLDCKARILDKIKHKNIEMPFAEFPIAYDEIDKRIQSGAGSFNTRPDIKKKMGMKYDRANRTFRQ